MYHKYFLFFNPKSGLDFLTKKVYKYHIIFYILKFVKSAISYIYRLSHFPKIFYPGGFLMVFFTINIIKNFKLIQKLYIRNPPQVLIFGKSFF
jgi:hypothetical protein